ncbi:MAG TPA: hypothetical protein VLJ68_12280 [Chitinophagaceae bacterium]|nr:hypothetical protein [Chitinophagaceae bacterium]
MSISLQLYDWTDNQDIIGTVITVGYFMGMIIVPVTILCYLFVLLIKKRLKGYVPLWIVFGNIIFLFIFLYYLFYLNDHSNT